MSGETMTLYESITLQIIHALENAGKFELPWYQQSALPTNAITNNHYNGINILSLWSMGIHRGYWSSQWATYKQWQSIGGQVNKGEKATQILIYKPLEGELDENQQERFLIRAGSVFNIQQVSGVEAFSDMEGYSRNKVNVVKHVDSFVENTKAELIHAGHRACYLPSTDQIIMPEKIWFKGSSTSTPTETYYSTLLHELTHWTGHASRCDRDIENKYGSEAYAMEELVAELGAAFLCAELGITNSPRSDHASYIKQWLKVLKEDDKAIMWASHKASSACAYLKRLQSKN